MRISPIQLWTVIVVMGGCNAAFAAPNVDCNTGTGSITRAICDDQQLSRLNREIHELLRKALLVGDPRSLVAAQRNWLVERYRACANKQKPEIGACLLPMLTARIADLKTMSAAPPPASDKVAVSTQPAFAEPAARPTPTCDNAAGPIERTICNDKVLDHWEDRLGRLYQQALDDPPFRTMLADDQQRWIRDRAGSCGSLPAKQVGDCILQMTKMRIEQYVQVINSRHDTQDRAAKIENILAGKAAPTPGLNADTIDRESMRAEQSELILNDARTCIRRNLGSTRNFELSDHKQIVAFFSARCFPDFSKRMTSLALGALAEPSFQMLVREEFDASK